MKSAGFFHSLRYIMAGASSLAISYALFYFMQSITLQNDFDSSAASTSPLQHIQFIRVKRNETLEIKERKAPSPPKIKTAPPAVAVQQHKQLATSAPSAIALPPIDIPTFSGVKIPTGILNISSGSIAVDEETIPIFRVPPLYPHRAAKRGLEGWVKVEFTITTQGRVKNAHVLEASPKGIFEHAALRAIARWKFKPKIVNKLAVERLGEQVFTFSLEEK